jgi:uncharacterized protein (DUF305 family)
MRTLLAALAAVILLAVGCGPKSASPSTEEGPPHNPSDVYFAQTMIEHHEQALEMAQLAADRAGNQDVKDLASEIESAQEGEIETMQGWLDAWGEDAMSNEMDHTEMPGMVSGSDMAELKQARGAAFDRLFLTSMIAHHEGAIAMARSEKADGINPDTSKLASAVIKNQTAEMRRMQAMLA